jgi:NADH-quinone oxidoreductase subunit L
VQSDIKRILAFSTISQIGYMMLGLGVGAFSLGIFHFFTHAFYKALLFLAAGTVIHSLHGEQNVFNMGGLRKSMPGVYLVMLVGAASLAGIPLTSGFFSKDAVLWNALTTSHGHMLLYAAGVLTSLLTAIYAFRLVFLVFAGEPRKDIHVHAPHGVLVWPLYILAAFALLIGFINVPHAFPKWEHYFHGVFGHYQLEAGTDSTKEFLAMIASGVLALFGAGIAWMLYNPKRALAIKTPMTVVAPGLIETSTPAPYRAGIANALFHGWFIDRLYDRVFVRGYIGVTRVFAWIDEVLVDGLFEATSVTVQLFHGFFVTLQNGRLSRYALMMLFGAVGVAAIIFFVVPRGM